MSDEEREERELDLTVPEVVTKYKSAAEILNKALQLVLLECKTESKDCRRMRKRRCVHQRIMRKNRDSSTWSLSKWLLFTPWFSFRTSLIMRRRIHVLIKPGDETVEGTNWDPQVQRYQAVLHVW